jgi:hypothetical protein
MKATPRVEINKKSAEISDDGRAFSAVESFVTDLSLLVESASARSGVMSPP